MASDNFENACIDAWAAVLGVARDNVQFKTFIGQEEEGEEEEEKALGPTWSCLSVCCGHAAAYSCLICHQPIGRRQCGRKQCGIRLRDQASGIHEKCWENVLWDLHGVKCLLCEEMVDGLGLQFSDDGACHLPCISSAYDPEYSTITCKTCRSPAPMRIDDSELLADCSRAKCRKIFDEPNQRREQWSDRLAEMTDMA